MIRDTVFTVANMSIDIVFTVITILILDTVFTVIDLSRDIIFIVVCITKL
jgi:hypothetical protein